MALLLTTTRGCGKITVLFLLEKQMAQKKGAGGKEQPYDKTNGQYLQSESGAVFTEKGKGYDSRDDFGQTVSHAQRTYRQNASYEEIRAADKRASSANVPTAVKFNRLNTKHHTDHAREMGYKNMRDYEAAAVEFFNSKKGKLYYSAARDRYYRYDEKTGHFCAASGETVHTFNIYTKKKFDKIKVQDKLYEIE